MKRRRKTDARRHKSESQAQAKGKAGSACRATGAARSQAPRGLTSRAHPQRSRSWLRYREDRRSRRQRPDRAAGRPRPSRIRRRPDAAHPAHSQARLHQSVQAAGAGRECAPSRAAGGGRRGHARDAVRRRAGPPSRPSDQAARHGRSLRTEVRGQGRRGFRERQVQDRAGRRNDRVTAPIPNLFKVPELKEKLLFTLLCLVIYRIGAHIATPGVNVDALADFMSTRGTGTLFGLYDLFSGGGLRRATVFALGIMPYISASIVFQLAGPVFPIIEKMQRDEEGKKTLTQWTRYLTVLLCIFQSYGYALFAEQLPGAVAHPGWAFRMTTVLTLSTGGVFIMWLGEQITERGIGNGASLLIFFSIVERIWPETLRTIEALRARSLTVPVLFLVLAIMVLVVAGGDRESTTP